MKTDKIGVLAGIILGAISMVAAPVFSFPGQKSIVSNIMPEYFDSFSNSLGNGVVVYDLQELATFDGKGYQKMSKGGWWYYPPMNYLALEGLPGLDWVAGYRADWMFEQKKDNTKMYILLSNLWHNWTSKKVTYFSPLVLYKVQLPGIKTNITSKNIELTGVYSWIDPKEPIGDARPSGESSELTKTRTSGLSIIGAEAGIKKISIPDFANIKLGLNLAKAYYESPYLNQGSTTTLVVYGPSLEGDIKGVKVKGEYAISKLDLTGCTTSAYAVYVELKKGFRENNLTVGGETYTLQPEYTTTLENSSGRFNFVDDNDDNDKWVDSNSDGQIAGWLDTTYPSNQWSWNPSNTNGLPVTMFFMLYDRDGDGMYDWEQPNIFYAAEHPLMWEGQDRNNNWVADKYEDDNLPDYKFSDYSLRKDLRGTNAYASYKMKDIANWTSIDTEGNLYWLLSSMEMTAGNLSETKISDSSKVSNETKYLRFSFVQKLEKAALLSAEYETKRVKDTFVNDLVEYGSFSGVDQLDFKDSVYDTLGVNLSIFPNRNFKIMNRMLSRMNSKIEEDTKESIQGMTTKIEYNYRLPESLWEPMGILEKVTFEPRYKYLTTARYDDGVYSDTYGNNLILQLKYEPIEGFVIRGGRNYLWLRDTDKTKESDGDLLAYELSFKTNASGYNVLFYGGYNKYKSVLPTTAVIKRDEDLYFVKVMVK